MKIIHSIKYPCVTIQDNGKFDVHINSITNAGNKMLGSTKRNMPVNSKLAQEKAYIKLIRPKIGYTAAAWDLRQKDQIGSLGKIQKEMPDLFQMTTKGQARSQKWWRHWNGLHLNKDEELPVWPPSTKSHTQKKRKIVIEIF